MQSQCRNVFSVVFRSCYHWGRTFGIFKINIKRAENTNNIILSLIFLFKTIPNNHSGTFVADVGHAPGNLLQQYVKIMERKLPSNVVFQWRVLKPHSVKISLVIHSLATNSSTHFQCRF